MHGLTYPQITRLGTRLESGGVSVGIGLDVGGGPLHPGIEEEGFVGHVVADEADDDGVPQDGGWASNCVEQLAGEVGLAFLAEPAEARADGGGLEGRLRRRQQGFAAGGGGCGGGGDVRVREGW